VGKDVQDDLPANASAGLLWIPAISTPLQLRRGQRFADDRFGLGFGEKGTEVRLRHLGVGLHGGTLGRRGATRWAPPDQRDHQSRGYAMKQQHGDDPSL
jgi:hypothetical protein